MRSSGVADELRIQSSNLSGSSGGNASKAVLSQFQEYQAIQYLAQLMMANISNPTTVGEIQWAIWDLTAPGLINQSADQKTGEISQHTLVL
jgi:hypothetical protein